MEPRALLEFDLNQERRPQGRLERMYLGKFVSLAGENSWISSLVASVFCLFVFFSDAVGKKLV